MAKARGNGEGSTYQRADGRWVAALVLPSGKRRVLYARSYEEARTKLRKEQRASEDGLPEDNGRTTVGDWLDHWLDKIVTNRNEPRTVQF